MMIWIMYDDKIEHRKRPGYVYTAIYSAFYIQSKITRRESIILSTKSMGYSEYKKSRKMTPFMK